jgi:hypothetical protein
MTPRSRSAAPTFTAEEAGTGNLMPLIAVLQSDVSLLKVTMNTIEEALYALRADIRDLKSAQARLELRVSSTEVPLSQARGGQNWSPTTSERSVTQGLSAGNHVSQAGGRQSILESSSVQVPDNSSRLDASPPRVRTSLGSPTFPQTTQLSLFPGAPGEEASRPETSLPIVVLTLPDSGFQFLPPMVTLHHSHGLAILSKFSGSCMDAAFLAYSFCGSLLGAAVFS